jgi:hypothetical protein
VYFKKTFFEKGKASKLKSQHKRPIKWVPTCYESFVNFIASLEASRVIWIFTRQKLFVISLSSLTQRQTHPRTSRESFNLFRVWVDHHIMRTSRENEQKCKFPFVMFRVSRVVAGATFLFLFFSFHLMSKKNGKELRKTRLFRRHYNDFLLFFCFILSEFH